MNTQFSKKDTNIVKGVAIIAMLFHHCYVTNINFKAHGVSFAPLSKGTVVTLSLWAKVCVGIFVFLSAYGITISLKKLYDCNNYNTFIRTVCRPRLDCGTQRQNSPT